MTSFDSSTHRALAAFCLLLVGAACTVPSLKELESERLRECDATHKCAEGYTCGADGFCNSSDDSCSSGASRGCGTDVGECTVGTQSCTAAGRWGSCDGIASVQEVCDTKDNDCDGQIDEEPVTNACGIEVGVCAGKKKACISGSEEAVCSILSYGGEYQPGGLETACDGKDNDCDGQTDENLSSTCGVDAGVCNGAFQPCRDGAFNGCIASDFLANSAQYESYEGKCDGLDNDCDRLTDSWSVRPVSGAGTLARGNVVAVAIPDAGTAAQADILSFYEEGSRVVMRQLFGDGRLNAQVYPAASVPASTKAYLPALATDGTALVAAWFDELPLPGGATSYRLNVGLPRSNGESFINNSPGATPILPLTGPGKALHVVASGGRIAIAWQWEDLNAGNAQKIGIANCPINLGTACATTTLTGTGLTQPRVALNPAGTELWVVYENGADSGRPYIAKANYTTPGGMGTLTAGPGFNLALETAGEPWVFYNAGGLRLFFLATSAATIVDRVKQKSCTLPCDIAANVGSVSTDAVSATGNISNIAITDSGGQYLIAYDEPMPPLTLVRYALAGNTLKTALVAGDPTEGSATRGWPVFSTRGANLAFTVLFQSDGTAMPVQSAVMMRRFCGP